MLQTLKIVGSQPFDDKQSVTVKRKQFTSAAEFDTLVEAYQKEFKVVRFENANGNFVSKEEARALVTINDVERDQTSPLNRKIDDVANHTILGMILFVAGLTGLCASVGLQYSMTEQLAILKPAPILFVIATITGLLMVIGNVMRWNKIDREIELDEDL